MKLRGLLSDVNIEGHFLYVKRQIRIFGLMVILDDLKLEFSTFPEIGLTKDLDDRTIWKYCQENGWILFTDNRNQEDENSLQSTLLDTWKVGDLPVITLGNKERFRDSGLYANQVVCEVADIIYGTAHGENREQPRIYVPRHNP